MTAKIHHVVIVYKANQETPLAFEAIACDSAEDAILAEALSKLPGNIAILETEWYAYHDQTVKPFHVLSRQRADFGPIDELVKPTHQLA